MQGSRFCVLMLQGLGYESLAPLPSFLGPFCGHLSPNVVKISQNGLLIEVRRAWRGATAADSEAFGHGFGFRVPNSGFRVQGSGFRVQGSGLRIQG
jgi:hypothetical protein